MKDRSIILIPVTFFLACEVVLFLFFLISPLDYNLVPYINVKFELLRIVLLVVGLSILIISFYKFFQKYRRSPTDVRLIILFWLFVFILAIGVKIFIETVRFGSELDRFFFNFVTFALFLSLYYFNLFGFSVLIAPGAESRNKKLRLVLLVFFFIIESLYLVDMSLQIFLSGYDSNISQYTEYVSLGFGLFCLISLFIMAFRSLALSRKTTEVRIRNGLRSLSISIFLIIACVIVLLVNELSTDYIQTLETAAISIAIVALYFVYMGFVKPTASDNS